MMQSYFLALLITLTSSHSVWAQAPAPVSPLGRLFHTPAERTLLERQRQLNLQETRRVEAGSLRLDGMVVRSSGKNTVWINQQRSDDMGVTATPSRSTPGQVTVITDSEPAADLKVGATLDRASGETAGGLSSGEIRVKR